MEIVTTERLRVRELALEDKAFIFQLVNTPSWLQYIGDRKVNSLQAAESYLLKGPIKSYQEHGFGLWMVESLKDRTPFGICGLIQRDFLEDVDIGFALLPEYEGQGFALESSRGVVQYAKDTLGVNRMLAITQANNDRSISLLQKLGMAFEKMIQIPPSGESLALYGMALKNYEH